MAFTVTPTSGAAPYVFEAEFSNRIGLDQGFYSLHFYATSGVGTCPAPTTSGTDQQNVVQALLNVGTYTQSGNSVPAGSCRVHNLVIREIATNNIVSSSSLSIDNV